MENNTALYHHGIKGQRWGIRRFQTKDGGLTSEGRKRYSLGEAIHNHKVKKKRQQAAEKARLAKTAKAEHEKKAVEGKLSVKDMTDDEIIKAINRKRLEDTYNQLHPKQVSKGEAFAKTLMGDVIKPAAVTAGKNFLTNYLDKVGKNLLKDQVDPNSIDALKDRYTKLDYKKKIMDLEDAIKNPNKRTSMDELAEEAKKADYMKKIYDADKSRRDYESNRAKDAEDAVKKATAAKKVEDDKKAAAQKEKEAAREKVWKEREERKEAFKKEQEAAKESAKAEAKKEKAEKLSDDDVETFEPDMSWLDKYNNYANSSSAKAATSSFVNSEASTALATISPNTTSAGQSFVAGLLEYKG